MNNKEYHIPDPRWEVFGYKTYESYLDKYLVRAKFHKNVPEEVVEAYTTVEYLIAHAYYFYPMYDEAISKLLKIVEMAVKIKCLQLNIPITTDKKRKSDGAIIKFDRKYKKLIDDVCKAEPEKKLERSMHGIRELRNMLMHPERNSFAGGMGIPSVYSCVLLLNKIFSEEITFSLIKSSLEGCHEKLLPLKGQPMFYNYETRKMLVWDVDVVDLVIIDEKCIFLLCLKPVMEVTQNIKNDKKVVGPQYVYIWANDVKISNDMVEGFDIRNKQHFSVKVEKTVGVEVITKEYKEYLTSLPAISLSIFNSEIGNAIAKFRYMHYDKLCV